MGLFDLFKKKAMPVYNSVVNEPVSSGTYTPPAPEFAKKKVITKTPLVEITTEVDGPPPLEALLKQATPSKGGLYPHEIMMLDYAHTYKTSDNSFQRFWYYQYSVKDPQAVLNSLYERGFIEQGSLRSVLECLKLGELKDELKLVNEKVSGKKAELIDRLLDAADHEALSAKYPERFFKLTCKGEQELKENQYVPYLHRHRYMGVWEMNSRIAQTHYPYRDVLWGYFNEQSGVHFQNYDFGLYRNVRLNMYQFLMEENKPKTAFHMLCEVLAFDLSGLGNSEKSLFEWERNDPKYFLMIYESRVEGFFPYEETTLIIPPAVSGWFADMQKTLELEDNAYRDAIIKELSEIHPPRRVFTDEECADIIIADIRNDVDTLNAIYKRAEKREKVKLKKLKS